AKIYHTIQNIPVFLQYPQYNCTWLVSVCHTTRYFCRTFVLSNFGKILKHTHPAATDAAASQNPPPEPPHYRALPYRRRIRLAVALFYFCQGLAFASWASRIP